MLRLCAVVLMLVVCAQAVPAVREQRDLSAAELRALYNSRVMKAERFTRLKNGMAAWVPNLYITTHSGVRVTLQNGRKYLIHKGPGYGSASDTVITDAANMSRAWQKKGGDTLCFRVVVTVGDMVRAGRQKCSLVQ
uniref:Uncharacterized protein n=1 Tax=Neogobius melanostomus TaxID=47308 RepID=A0A8C6T323_9GOBI